LYEGRTEKEGICTNILTASGYRYRALLLRILAAEGQQALVLQGRVERRGERIFGSLAGLTEKGSVPAAGGTRSGAAAHTGKPSRSDTCTQRRIAGWTALACTESIRESEKQSISIHRVLLFFEQSAAQLLSATIIRKGLVQ
jgi:hypothetical protein